MRQSSFRASLAPTLSCLLTVRTTVSRVPCPKVRPLTPTRAFDRSLLVPSLPGRSLSLERRRSIEENTFMSVDIARSSHTTSHARRHTNASCHRSLCAKALTHNRDRVLARARVRSSSKRTCPRAPAGLLRPFARRFFGIFDVCVAERRRARRARGRDGRRWRRDEVKIIYYTPLNPIITHTTSEESSGRFRVPALGEPYEQPVVFVLPERVRLAA